MKATPTLPAVARSRHPLHIIAAALLLTLTVMKSPAGENWMLSTAVPLPSPINLPNTFSGAPCLSADGRTLYFSSDRPGGYGKWDLWMAERTSVDAAWGEPVNLGGDVNTDAAEGMPTISADGLTLYFGDGNPFNWRARNGTPNDYQIWMTTRATLQSPWSKPVELAAPVGSKYLDDYPHLASDGLSLYFASARPESFGLNVAQRTSPNEPWTSLVNLGTAINIAGTWNAFPWVSGNGLHLLYQTDRSGGRGGFDLWISTRASKSAAWPTPINLGRQVNSAFYDVSPSASADFPALGSHLLFCRNDINGWNMRFNLYQAEVVPNTSLLRSTSFEGPWTPVNASFVPLSRDTIAAEASFEPSASQAFYRVTLLGAQSASLIAAERASNKFRVQIQWHP